MGFLLSNMVARLGGDIIGDGDTYIAGVSSLQTAQDNRLAFYQSANHQSLLETTTAVAVVLRRADANLTDKPRWIVKGEPRLYFAQAAALLHPHPVEIEGISARAEIGDEVVLGEDVAIATGVVVGRGAIIGDRCQIYAGSVIGAGSAIGADTIIYPRVVLYAGVTIGKCNVLHAGSVIGADGFGYADNNGSREKIPHIGSVWIGDRVEIGANSTIDRGTLDDTIIGHGVKIDNLVQIGHNVQIGDDTIICGNAGIAGSVLIGRRCMIGGGSGVSGHIKVGDNVKIAAYSVVINDVPANSVIAALWPAGPVRDWWRFVAQLRRLTKARK